jgi:hypothetical protein
VWIRGEFSSGWSAWSPLVGSITAASPPSLASWGSGRLDVITRASDGNIYKTAYHSGWEPDYSSLGAPSTGAAGAPVITAPATGQLAVFSMSTDGDLYWKTWNGSSWSGWGAILPGFTMTGDFSAVAAGGKTYLVIRKNDGTLYLLRIGTSLEAADIIGSSSGSGVGAPAIASWGTNRFDVFVRGGGNNFLWQKAFVNGSWTGWIALGGVNDGDPAAAEASGVSAIDVIADQVDQVGIHTLWTKGWR